jgi:hypothetical protein
VNDAPQTSPERSSRREPPVIGVIANNDRDESRHDACLRRGSIFAAGGPKEMEGQAISGARTVSIACATILPLCRQAGGDHLESRLVRHSPRAYLRRYPQTWRDCLAHYWVRRRTWRTPASKAKNVAALLRRSSAGGLALSSNGETAWKPAAQARV